MTALAAVLAGMLMVAGLVLLVAWGAGVGATRRHRAVSTSLWTKAVENLAGVSARAWVWTAAAVVITVVVTLWTRWPLMLVVVPLAVVGLPRLLSSPRQVEVELLGSLDRWVRQVTATMAAGRSITDALRHGARQAPAELAEPLALLVRRLDDRWTPADALLGFAADLDSADADAVVASLVLAVQRGGAGAVLTLSALADSLQDRLRALREIEVERAKPRIVVRQVTAITVVILGVALVMGRDFFAPYGTPVGQVILAALLGLYVAALVAMRRMTLPRRRARILREHA